MGVQLLNDEKNETREPGQGTAAMFADRRFPDYQPNESITARHYSRETWTLALAVQTGGALDSRDVQHINNKNNNNNIIIMLSDRVRIKMIESAKSCCDSEPPALGLD